MKFWDLAYAVIVATCLLAFLCAQAMAATLHTDTFDTSVQGWTGGGVPVHISTGGAGDGTGYLRVPSASGGNLATLNGNSSWTGDYLAIGANRLVVDLRVPQGAPNLAIRVVLFGPEFNQQRYTSLVAQAAPADGVWHNYTFSLESADLVPTQENGVTYSQIMGGVLQIMLRHDPDAPSHGGENVMGELHVDNVELAAVSAPLTGDFDGDGAVTAADLTHPQLGWKQRFGVDLDGNDFLAWQRGLNLPAAAAVPEPATQSFVVAALAVAPLLSWRRNGRGRPLGLMLTRRHQF